MQPSSRPWIVFAACAALVAGVLSAAAPAGAQSRDKDKQAAAAAAPQPNYSKGFRKEASKVQKLVTEQKWDEVLAAIPALEALEGLNDDDRRVLWTWKISAHQGKQDWPALAQAYATWADSGLVEKARLPDYYRQVAAIYSSRLKDNAQALGYFRKAIEVTPEPAEDDLHLLLQLTRQQKDCKGLIEWTDKASAMLVARGAQPRESWLQNLDGCFIDLGDKERRLQNLEQLTMRFPKRDYYTRVTSLYQQGSKDDRVVMLNLWRLALKDVGLATVGEYLNYADVAMAMGGPGETVRALERGMAEGLVPKAGSNQQLLAEAKAAVATDRKSLPAEEKAAAAAARGEVAAKVGLGYYGTGDYAKALENVQRGIAKGGVKRIDDARMLEGILLVQLGRKAEAVTAFQAAEQAAGTGSWLARVARLWAAYAGRPEPQPAPPAAPPAPPPAT